VISDNRKKQKEQPEPNEATAPNTYFKPKKLPRIAHPKKTLYYGIVTMAIPIISIGFLISKDKNPK
jgi:hypothetical protein